MCRSKHLSLLRSIWPTVYAIIAFFPCSFVHCRTSPLSQVPRAQRTLTKLPLNHAALIDGFKYTDPILNFVLPTIILFDHLRPDVRFRFSLGWTQLAPSLLGGPVITGTSTNYCSINDCILICSFMYHSHSLCPSWPCVYADGSHQGDSIWFS